MVDDVVSPCLLSFPKVSWSLHSCLHGINILQDFLHPYSNEIENRAGYLKFYYCIYCVVENLNSCVCNNAFERFF